MCVRPLPFHRRVLRLESVYLGDAGCEALASALVKSRHRSSLRALRVARCGFSSSGCAWVCGFLLKSRLRSLDLSGNAIREDGVKALIGALQGRAKSSGGRESATETSESPWGPLGSTFEVRLSENPLCGAAPCARGARYRFARVVFAQLEYLGHFQSL